MNGQPLLLLGSNLRDDNALLSVDLANPRLLQSTDTSSCTRTCCTSSARPISGATPRIRGWRCAISATVPSASRSPSASATTSPTCSKSAGSAGRSAAPRRRKWPDTTASSSPIAGSTARRAARRSPSIRRRPRLPRTMRSTAWLAPGQSRPIGLTIAATNRRPAKRRFLHQRPARRRTRVACSDPRRHDGRNVERTVQRDPLPVGRRPADADDRHAGWALSLRGHSLVLDDLRPRWADHGDPDAVVRCQHRPGRAAAPGGPSIEQSDPLRRPAGQDPARCGRAKWRRSARCPSRCTTAALTPRPLRPAGRPLCRAYGRPWNARSAPWPAVEAGLAWIDHHGDIDRDGFVEYFRESETGLVNQGWKDSLRRDLSRRRDACHRPDRARRGAGLRVCGQVHARPLRRALEPDATRHRGSRGSPPPRRRNSIGNSGVTISASMRWRWTATSSPAGRHVEHGAGAVFRHRTARPRTLDRGGADARSDSFRLGHPHRGRARRATTRCPTTTARSGRTTTR